MKGAGLCIKLHFMSEALIKAAPISTSPRLMQGDWFIEPLCAVHNQA